jgi:hypothetical protein
MRSTLRAAPSTRSVADDERHNVLARPFLLAFLTPLVLAMNGRPPETKRTAIKTETTDDD